MAGLCPWPASRHCTREQAMTTVAACKGITERIHSRLGCLSRATRRWPGRVV
jgi:hypothetical protein